MRVRIYPTKSSRVTITPPSSKSLCHRALIAAALADGVSHISNINLNADVLATLNALKKMNVSYQIEDKEATIRGNANLNTFDPTYIDVGESGSTLRFLLPLFVNSRKKCHFHTQGRLAERPLDVYQEIIEKNFGTFIIKDGDISVKGSFPARYYKIRGDISSQFISGLLFALPLHIDDSSIEVIPPYESASYVDLTIDILKKAGITIMKDSLTYQIPGSQTYRPFNYKVECDDSSAAFFAVEALLCRKTITINGMSRHSLQPDHKIIDIVRRFNGKVQEEDEWCTFFPSPISAAEVDLADCPDLGPALFVLASRAKGVSVFHNTQRLRLKESDRLSAMKTELAKMGHEMHIEGSDVFIKGSEQTSAAIIDSHNDHRIAMAMSILALCADMPSLITDAQAVNKSYPDFYNDLIRTETEVEFL